MKPINISGILNKKRPRTLEDNMPEVFESTSSIGEDHLQQGKVEKKVIPLPSEESLELSSSHIDEVKSNAPVPVDETKKIMAEMDPLIMRKLFPHMGDENNSSNQKPSLLQKRITSIKVSGATRKDDKADYDKVSIEEFGEAMLRGMGMSEEVIEAANKPVQEKTVDKKLASVPPSYRDKQFLGIGAAPNPLIGMTKQSNSVSEFLDAARKESKSGTFDKFPLRSLVEVTEGPNVGSLCLVWQNQGVPGLERIKLRLFHTVEPKLSSTTSSESPSISLEFGTVFVEKRRSISAVPESSLTGQQKSDLDKLRAKIREEDKLAEKRRQEAKKESEERIKQESDLPEDKSLVLEGKTDVLSTSGSKSTSVEPKEKLEGRFKWLVEGIRVRCVSTSDSVSAVYKQRGTVLSLDEVKGYALVDFDSRSSGSSKPIRMKMKESELENIVPHENNVGLIIGGKYKGMKGVVIRRHSEKQKCSVSFHKKEGDLEENVWVHFDDIAALP